ncbi:CoA transferase subunit A [Streptomyces sp. L7]
MCGIPSHLIRGHRAGSAATSWRWSRNNCGTDGTGLGVLLAAGRISRATSSYVGENKEFARQYLSGEIELELTPQGTLAERLRAGGAGIPAFYTPAGVGTVVADGGLPWPVPPRTARWRCAIAAQGDPGVQRAAVRTCWRRASSPTSPWCVPAKGDRHGNLVYEASARNFNPLIAMAGRVTIAEVEELVEPGELGPRPDPHPGRVRPARDRGRRGRKADREAHRTRRGRLSDGMDTCRVGGPGGSRTPRR